MQKNDSLEQFYSAWSDKTSAQISYDVSAASRKLAAIQARIPSDAFRNFDTVAEIGCGYGRFLSEFCSMVGASAAHGFDFSEAAINFANANFANSQVSFHRTPTLAPEESAAVIRDAVGKPIDCILLIDLLEHIPDCRSFMHAVSGLARYFLVKLPIESTILDNYFLRKEYPSTRHSDGHLREFDVNTVHYFVRQLGFTPLIEGLYAYDFCDMFPPPAGHSSLKGRLFRVGLMTVKSVARAVLPTRWFLRIVGGGGYFCLATHDQAHMLNP